MPIVPSPMNPTRSLMIAPRLDVPLGDGGGGAHRMPDAGHDQRRALSRVQQERGELLHRRPAEAGPEAAAAHPAVEQAALGLERARIEGLAQIAREVELHRPQRALVEGEAEALNDERRVDSLEPVPLTLAEDEVPSGLGPSHGPQEEAEHRGVHDLGAVVEDAAVPVDL